MSEGETAYKQEVPATTSASPPAHAGKSSDSEPHKDSSQSLLDFLKEKTQEPPQQPGLNLPGDNGHSKAHKMACPISGDPCPDGHGGMCMVLHDLALWIRPVVSGFVLASGIMIWLLLTVGGYSVTSLTTLIMLCYLVTCATYANVLDFWARFSTQIDWRRDREPSPVTLVDAQGVRDSAEAIARSINGALTTLQDLAVCKSNLQTFKAIAVLYIGFRLVSAVSIATMLGLSLLFFFSLPIGYARNREIVDQQVVVVKKVVVTNADKARVLIANVPIAQKLLETIAPSQRAKSD